MGWLSPVAGLGEGRERVALSSVRHVVEVPPSAHDIRRSERNYGDLQRLGSKKLHINAEGFT